MDNIVINKSPVSIQPSRKFKLILFSLIITSFVSFIIGLALGYTIGKKYPCPSPSVTPLYPTPTSNTPTITPLTTSPQPTTVKEDKYGLEIPPIYSQLNWTKVSPSNQVFNTIFWHTQNYEDSGKISLIGTEWSVNKIISSKSQEESLKSPLTTYYYEELTKRGWSSNIPSFSSQQYEFGLSSAAGPTGSIDGYYKVSGNSVRIIYISEEMPAENWGGSGSSGNIFPYTLKYGLFVSDILPLEKLVSQIAL